MNSHMIRNTDNCGQRIDALRKEHNETKSALAEVIGVSPGHLTYLLQDHYKWSEDKVLSAAKHYGVSFFTLYYGTEQAECAEKMEEHIAQIKQILSMLPESERKETWRRILKELIDSFCDGFDNEEGEG